MLVSNKQQTFIANPPGKRGIARLRCYVLYWEFAIPRQLIFVLLGGRRYDDSTIVQPYNAIGTLATLYADDALKQKNLLLDCRLVNIR